MIRILQCVNDMHRAGLETMLMNYYRHIDRDNIQFDFLTHRPYKSDYDDEIISMGGRVFYAPRLYPQNYNKYFKYMAEFYDMHPEYKIVHSHIDAMSYIPLLAAKKSGVPIRIAHSHNTSIDKDFKFILKMIFKKLLPIEANYFCACGEKAAHFLFKSDNVTIIPNAIEIEKFIYSETIRNEKRRELNVEDKLVIGHVGRLSYQKNHEFLLKIFKNILENNPNAMLLLIGEGEKEAKLKKMVLESGINENVIFAGKRTDVNEIYQAMDVFVMPSLFEGVPVTGIEAQVSGLPCIFSDRVPKETLITKNGVFLSLNTSVDVWTERIMNSVNKDRKKISEKMFKSKYNIENSVKGLERYYMELNKSIN